MDDFDAPACIERVQCGDEAAARELFREFHPLVLRLVRSHLPRRTSEEDLCQAVFVKIFARLSQYSGQVPLSHWVSRITINTCLNELRAEKVRPELRMSDLSEAQAQVLENLTTASGDLAASESLASRELVELLLQKLDPDDRLVIHLLHLEERSVQEVATLTGWNRTMVKVKAFRARAKLRKHLATLREEEPL
jgi:RNA polymerase sigma factor (sigma-70 family)